jgi:hypothetical protein
MAHPRDGRLHLGERTGPDHERDGEALALDPAGLTTHGVIVGMTGSGKTGLAVGLIEEALLQGVPVLAIDPKGDLGNLALTFPDLSPASFAPWTDGADPVQVATTWRDGLAGWGLDGADVQALRDAGPVTIYTPGSTAGIGLNVVASLRRPAESSDPEAVLDEVEGYVSGLLGLVDIQGDPLSSREHILLSNVVQQAWAAATTSTWRAWSGRSRTRRSASSACSSSTSSSPATTAPRWPCASTGCWPRRRSGRGRLARRSTSTPTPTRGPRR